MKTALTFIGGITTGIAITFNSMLVICAVIIIGDKSVYDIITNGYLEGGKI